MKATFNQVSKTANRATSQNRDRTEQPTNRNRATRTRANEQPIKQTTYCETYLLETDISRF
jgi:hypothetical protein